MISNTRDIVKLSELINSEEGIIVKVKGHGAFRKRITEMGFIKGKAVKVIKSAPLQDPIEYEIMGYRVSLRKSEAELIEVVTVSTHYLLKEKKFQGTIDEEILKVSALEKGKIINVALVGNPNCGKTTLFNYASGSHERVGNYSGVTIDAKEGTMKKDGYTFHIVDLPGTYSVTDYSPEELYVRKYITESNPDIVVNVVDASNLERNLYLTTQLIDMNIKVVIALNMWDELEKKGVKLKIDELGVMIGIPIIPTVAYKGKGISELFTKLIEVYEDKDPIVRHIHINYGIDIEEAIANIQKQIKLNKYITDKYSSRYLSIKLLESDKSTRNLLKPYNNIESIIDESKKCIHKLEKKYNEKAETLITDAKYGFIDGALKETFIDSPDIRRKKVADIDNIITHKIFGFPVFIFLLWLMFQTTFTLGSYPMEWIEKAVSLLSDFVRNTMSDGALKDLLVDGIIGGVGGVIVFLPNILILFFFISLMEDTGYMARASFIMDKLMHKIGLHGKSFIPLVMGFGCNVPAIMATRTLENKKDRILTMIITPFMSCSARLPVYVLFISAFFPSNQGLMLFMMYFIGILLAIIVAIVMKKLVFSKQDVPFVMELPPYRVPTIKNTTMHMWFKGSQYLKKMGSVILLASILIWALGYYPRDVEFSKNYDAHITAVKTDTVLTEESKNEQISLIEIEKESERQEKSYIGQIGHAVEPVIKPLGFDWRLGVCIITGMAAKEIVISTMGVLYQVDLKADEKSLNLKERIKSKKDENGNLFFTPLKVISFLLFILIYFPCVAVIATIAKESNWKWAVFVAVYTTLMAWLISFSVYQIGSLLL